MPKLREVKQFKLSMFATRTKEKCPHCSKELYFDIVPYLDEIPGCPAIHCGYRCPKCGKCFVEAEKGVKVGKDGAS